MKKSVPLGGKDGEKRPNKPGQQDPVLKRSFKGHKDAILATCFNPTLRQVVSGSADSTVMVWGFKPNVRPFRFVGHRGPVYSVDISPTGNTIVSGSADDTIRVWNNSVEGFSHVIKSHSAPVRSVALSQDGSLLLSGSDDKSIKCFQLKDRKFMFSIAAH
jgi:centriolar protein POC1